MTENHRQPKGNAGPESAPTTASLNGKAQTIAEAIRRAVRDRNSVMAARIADTLRFRFGYNYQQTQELFNRCAPECTAELFEDLMWYADTYENRFEEGGR